MQLFRSMQTSASALTAGRLQMDLIANNIANMNSTRSANGDPYRRRVAVQAERVEPFALALTRSEYRQTLHTGAGVRVVEIREDESPFRLKHDPAHPDAGPDGMVRLPNVDLLQEITDMMLATRIYEANITAFNAGKAMAQRALEIGR